MYASELLTTSKPLGSIQRGFGLSSPNWLLADGRAVLRADYPSMSQLFPFGKTTVSIRTLVATPAVPLVAAYNGAPQGSFFVAGAAGTSALIQVPYLGGGGGLVTTLSITPSALLVAGARVFMLNSGAAQGLVVNDISGLQVNTALTNGPVSVVAGTSMSRLIAATSLNPATGGAIIALPSTSGNLFYAMMGDQTSFTPFTLPETSVKQAMCWTGTHLLILKSGSASMLKVQLTNVAGTLTLGTVTTVTLPEAIAAGQGNIASNQNGTVVISGVASGLLVSYDHGEAFSQREIYGVPASDSWRVQYSDGAWIVPTASGLLLSEDAKAWQVDPSQTFNVATGVARLLSWGRQFLAVSASTTAYNLAESTTQFAVPNLRSFSQNASGEYVQNEPAYIKAR